jgi:transposase-like protein
MADGVGLSTDRRVRRFRSLSEKHQIVELTLKPGASVAEVARAHGVNSNQVFKWRRAFERGELSVPSVALIPVTVAGPEVESRETEEATSAGVVSRITYDFFRTFNLSLDGGGWYKQEEQDL